jgi:acetolactate synthase-1/2/3 large subunit
MTRTSDLVVKALEMEGVKFIFGIPGEENLDLLDSLRVSKIKLILTRHEQAAGFMAATYGRLTGTPGVCMSTLGPGATNLVTAAAYAQLGGMPMVMITGQKPIMKSKQALFQIIDVVEMMGPITKMSKQVIHSHTITAVIREAFRVARDERPGAVHIEIPEDIASQNSDAEIFPITSYRNPSADDKSIEEAVSRIHDARAPLILIGAGANRRRPQKAITKLVAKTGIPFFTTQLGKGVVDERSKLCLGTAALSSNDCVHLAVEASDLLINIGHDLVEKPPFFMKRGGVEVIDINFFPASVDEVYFPQVEVVGDISSSIKHLTTHLEPQGHWDFSYFMEVKESLDKSIELGACDTSFPIALPMLVNIIREVMPEDGILSLDNGMYKIWFARNYKAYQPNTVLLDNALASMGAGLPAAIAAKMVYPGRRVLAICGDGGFMMNSQEMETAVRLKLDLVVLVLNDNGFGMIKWKQEISGFKEFGLDFGNPDFEKYAESYGAYGHKIEKMEDIAPKIIESYRRGGVHLIEIPVDYKKNSDMLKQCMLDINQEVCDVDFGSNRAL